VKAFIPAEWVGQEALRLELYRRIATARDHAELAAVRAEAEDRFGALPGPVEALFAVASLKLACLQLGVEEVITFRKQVRVRPVPDGMGHEVAAARAGATFHPTTSTLNLDPPGPMGGQALAEWVEDVLRRSLREAPNGAPGEQTETAAYNRLA
jgi:transcription-repair coupling factor (superfamily II helicase)